MGSGFATWADEPYVEDRKFLEVVILSCLRAMQRDDAMQILEEYTAYDAKKVSSKKPDFMNRASIPFLIEDYANDRNTEHSFAKLSGDAGLARLKQERISKAAQRVGSEMGIPGLKYAMDFNGYYGGPARLPFLPLTAALKQEVEQLMADIRN